MSEQFRSTSIVVILVALLAGLVVVATPQDLSGGKVFRGVWHEGFEKAACFEGYSTDNLPNFYETSDGWLSFDEGAWPSEVRSPNDPDWDDHAIFEIEFFGRRIDGLSGHMDHYPAEYFAEDVIRIERLSLEDAIRASTPPRGKRP
ncbi:MAG: hypothetical protein WBA51_10045 [Erythrobacter sp.]